MLFYYNPGIPILDTISYTHALLFLLSFQLIFLGEIIYGGDRGAEGVLGALVRHLLDKTEILKNYALSPDYQCRYIRMSYVYTDIKVFLKDQISFFLFF